MDEPSLSSMVVGFVGLGRMGSPMAKNILKSGYRMVVWSRTSEKVRQFEGLGASIARSPKEVAEKSNIIICMLSTPQVTEDVILGLRQYRGESISEHMSLGSIVVDMSTNSPSVVKRMAKEVRNRGCDLVSAPVIGSSAAAADARLVVLASGDERKVEYIRPILGTMAEKVWYVGEVGTASALKLILNLYLWMMVGAFSECLVLSVKMGINPEVLMSIWNTTVLKNYITEYKARKVLDGDWTPAAALEVALKDLLLASAMADEVNIPIPLGNLTKELFTSAASIGLKDLDYMALTMFYEKIANVNIPKRSDFKRL